MSLHAGTVLCMLAMLVVAAATSDALGAKPPKPRSRAEVEAALAKAPKPDALRPLHVVLLADVKDHGREEHDYPLWQKRWALLLGGRKAAGADVPQVNLFGPAAQGNSAECVAGAEKVTLTTAWKWPSDEQLDTADLIVMFCYRSGGASRQWNEAQMKRLEGYLARGGGFVYVHSPTYTTRDLSAPGGARIAALSGLAFDRTIKVRHGAMTIKLTDPTHPICLGLPESIQLIDEPYWPPIGDPATVTVLATSQEDGKPQPMFWTCQKGKGRVYSCVLGHYTWTFDDPYVRMLVLRGMAWAAGESPYRFDPLVLRGARVE